MRITIDTATPLSARDTEILRLLLEAQAPAAKPTQAPAAKTSTEAPAAKPAEKAKPAEEPTEAAEEVTKETMDAAVSKAKALIQDGDKAKVRKALESAGLARVGAIETEDQGQKFLQALGG